ncbi:MAG: hypothetical protein DMG90_11590 [Acidobacteria bacterium]|nr:MAG: hypothetical protein DMG90_11590 [Acidobacteriota bacterium]
MEPRCSPFGGSEHEKSHFRSAASGRCDRAARGSATEWHNVARSNHNQSALIHRSGGHRRERQTGTAV